MCFSAEGGNSRKTEVGPGVLAGPTSIIKMLFFQVVLLGNQDVAAIGSALH